MDPPSLVGDPSGAGPKTGTSDEAQCQRRRRAVLKRAFEKHVAAMRKNVHGLECNITLKEVLAAWEHRGELRCATTGWADDLRIVPARPGAFTATNMELVHRTLYSEFKMDGAPESCYQALLGGSQLPVARPHREASHEDEQLHAWVSTRPLRFVVDEVMAIADISQGGNESVHNEVLDHSCAALGVRSPDGSRIVLIVACGAPTFIKQFKLGCCSWELPDGAVPPTHWDRARGGLLCRLFGNPPVVPPVCVVTHRRPTLVEVRLPPSVEKKLRLQENLYSLFGGLETFIDADGTHHMLNQVKSMCAVRGPVSLMNHRRLEKPHVPMPRLEPAALGASGLAILGVTTARELATLCCARRMTDSATEEAFDEEEFAAHEGARAEAEGEDWSEAHRTARDACAQLLRAQKLERRGGLLAWT